MKCEKRYLINHNRISIFILNKKKKKNISKLALYVVLSVCVVGDYGLESGVCGGRVKCADPFIGGFDPPRAMFAQESGLPEKSRLP